MTKERERQPELFIVANDAASIYRRFQGWPDLAVDAADESVLTELPAFEQLTTIGWRERLQEMSRAHLDEFCSAVKALQTVWTAAQLPEWKAVAHSLVVHYLLWTVGGQLLLNHYQTEAAAMTIQMDTSDAIWSGFLRSNHNYGISCLLGGCYVRSVELRDLLAKADVQKTMATLAADRSLLPSSSTANRILSRLGGLTGSRTEDGSAVSAWPIIEPAQMLAVRPELGQVAAAWSLLLGDTVYPLADACSFAGQSYQKADLALGGLALLARILVDDLVRAKLLPTPVEPLLDGLV